MLGILFGNVDFHMKRFVSITQSNIDPIDGSTSIRGGY
jgi:hypothetical protein